MKLAICSICVVTTISSMACNHAPPPVVAMAQTNPALAKQIDDTVARSIADHTILRVDPDGHEVLVSPLVWAIWNADAKKAFAVTLATYCNNHGAFHGLYLDVIDSQSAKKLAHYGPSGFEVF